MFMDMQHFANTHRVVGAPVVKRAQERKLRVTAGDQDQTLAPEPQPCDGSELAVTCCAI